MNTKLRKEAKNDFEKDFFKLKNNAVFGKTMENVRKYRDMKLVTADKRRNELESEPNYHTTKNFSENLMAIDMKKTEVKMNKASYFGMSILDISKTCMNFGMITLNQNINGVALNTEQNCATWSLAAFLFISKPKITNIRDKRLQTFDKITTYPYGTNASRVCESEMLSKI